MEKENELRIIVLNNSDVKIDIIENVKLIQINDKNYNLLIMKDYWPLLGEINGSLNVEAENVHHFDNISGFYTLSNNTFHLIIKEKG